MNDNSPLDLSRFAGVPIAVMGLGISGLPSARLLAAARARVTVWDDGAAARAEAEAAGLPLVDFAADGLGAAVMLVLSPGIAHTHPTPHPVAALAAAAGIPIVCDVELFLQARLAVSPASRLVVVTGTNGKSTTTALIGHLLGACGVPVATGGNLGTAALTLPALPAEGVYVLELSSYQLERVPSLRPDVAVLLNITPDHLGRHGGMAGYRAAKERAVAAAGIAVFGMDDAPTRALAAAAGDRARPVSAEGPAAAAWIDAELRLVDGPSNEPVVDLKQAHALPGRHNGQNAAAAYAAVRALGLDDVPCLTTGLLTFPGLPHRQQVVARIPGPRGPVLFVNDSKATNADAAVRALGSYPRVLWIAGGRPKEGGLAGIEPYLDHVAKAFLIGEAEDQFATWLALQGVEVERCETLDVATMLAAEAAFEGVAPVVLLSPACASFDQFRSFEHRGDEFRRLVAELNPFTAGGPR